MQQQQQYRARAHALAMTRKSVHGHGHLVTFFHVFTRVRTRWYDCNFSIFYIKSHYKRQHLHVFN